MLYVSTEPILYIVINCQDYGISLFSDHITVMSHEHHDNSKQWQFHWVFKSLSKLTAKQTSKLQINGPLWGESTSDW